MADPSTYRPASGEVPDAPGVYRFRDEHGRVIYVGKAKSLRQRLNSYFADQWALHPRTRTMVTTAEAVDWVTVANEVEALQLEYSWIKEFDPRFNVKYRDDKSYPSLAVTLSDEYPRLMVMRGPKRKGVRYFGPYSHAWAIRETLDLLLRVFPARTCSNGVFKRAGQVGRPCLLGYIGKCSAPCVGRVSAEEHRAIVEDFCAFMAGQTTPYMRRVEREMKQASDAQDYERAARLRDDLSALRKALEKNAVVLGDGTDADVVSLAQDQLEAAIQVFYVRGGRVRGQRGFVVDVIEDLSPGEVVGEFLVQAYGGIEPDDVPREVLVPAMPPDHEALTTWLSGMRGSRVELRIPQRGDKRALMETVRRNAEQALNLHKTRRAGDLTTRSVAMQEIQDALGLDQAPLRIECFDVSNLQATDTVASMVVFEDGLQRRSEYRRFALRSVGIAGEGSAGADAGANDVAAMHEVISRRFRRYLEERVDSADIEVGADADESDLRVEVGQRRRFAYPPNLVVVDGGPPQVAAAARAMAELGIDDVALCGLAKRLEEVWLPDRPDPVILPRASQGLYLLQRVRDEAHRFAITYHRQKRSKSMTTSSLDDVPGLGDVRRKALLRHFGSLKRLRAATADEIAAVPGIGPRTAQAIKQALREPAESAVNTATGEILSG